MKMRRYAFATVALVSLFPLAAPLRACCDDFWSCAAAVATGGLSCAVEDLINSVKTLITNVSRLASTLGQQAMDVVNLAKNELSGAANDLRNLAGQAESDFNSAAQAAQTIVNEASRPQMIAPQAIGALATTAGAGQRAGGGMVAPAGGARPAVPTPARTAAPAGATGVMHFDPPVSPQDLLDALRRAQQAVDGLRPDVTQPINQVRQFATQAEQQAAAAASSAANIAQTALLAPLQTLGNMLQDLVNHPEHIFDPSKIVDDAITQITNQAITTMTQVHDAVMQQAKGTLDMAQKPLQDALDRASVAKKIADAMQRLQRARSKSALDALNAVVPRQRVDVHMLVSQVAAATHPSGITALNLGQHHGMVLAPFNRITASRLTARAAGAQMAAQLKGPWMQFKRIQAAPPKADPAARNRMEAELTQRFAGKSPAQAAAEKQALLNEARARFARDPKTLQKVEAMLNGDPVIQNHLGPHGPAVQQQ
ncbi:hypothetical protein GETHPA_00320 [Geothrix rubra]|uniref:Uncharacterized protein n=1 Tax=Geothrix rubra TaxID=2927977 RepID=A0ABQ5Q1G6_9BACT|nr:hypothetical protein [Geothrix rubra]GLH68499.1 hypothetical protein GETHPA_00320 [Geothrix rubra]